jgi:hypothetical protein
MKKLLASKHGFICRTRILVTSPQTVAFYRQKEKVGNYLGITKVGKWLQNDRFCVDNQVVRTLTWDINGKPSRSVSSKKVSNLNTQLTLVYPQDFKAQKTNTLVTCQAKVLNLSKRPLALYAGKIATDTRVALLKPYQQTQVVAPCFKEQALIGVQVQQSSSQLSVSYYNTPKKYTDLNALPVLEFPRQFILQSQQTVELKADLLKLLLAAL